MALRGLLLRTRLRAAAELVAASPAAEADLPTAPAGRRLPVRRRPDGRQHCMVPPTFYHDFSEYLSRPDRSVHFTGAGPRYKPREPFTRYSSATSLVAEQHNAVPFSLLFPFRRFAYRARFGSCQREVGDSAARMQRASGPAPDYRRESPLVYASAGL